MKLIDLLSVTDEFTNVSVYDRDYDLLSKYDGKNSIDEELNDLPIYKVGTSEDGIVIIVDSYQVIPW